jgi:hypothetical protein
MNAWYDEPEVPGNVDLCDPLQVERAAPITDEEAATIEELCEAATPGPLVIDDVANGEGIVVATLPDGRHLISRVVSHDPEENAQQLEANARLMCRARCYLLRLVRDRQRWQRTKERLLERISALEATLSKQVARKVKSRETPRTSARPR